MGKKYFGRQAIIRGVYIISEGQTEEEFINTTIAPYLSGFGIYDVRAILLETSPGYKGGDMKFSRFRKNAENLLKSQKDIVVTSLLDFFRLKTDFPKYDEAKKIDSKIDRISFLEQAIKESIDYRFFLPYIQLHEFEALLFSDTKGFEIFPEIPAKNKNELEAIVTKYPNPELLNDGDTTAPSKRLKSLIPGYDKVLYSANIISEIGMPKIIEKYPRFNTWVEKIIEMVKAGEP